MIRCEQGTEDQNPIRLVAMVQQRPSRGFRVEEKEGAHVLQVISVFMYIYTKHTHCRQQPPISLFHSLVRQHPPNITEAEQNGRIIVTHNLCFLAQLVFHLLL